jgi:hypothetical protein
LLLPEPVNPFYLALQFRSLYYQLTPPPSPRPTNFALLPRSPLLRFSVSTHHPTFNLFNLFDPSVVLYAIKPYL